MQKFSGKEPKVEQRISVNSRLNTACIIYWNSRLNTACSEIVKCSEIAKKMSRK